MKRAVVAIIDAAHARLYTYQHDPDQAPRLHEVRELVNPDRQARGLFSNEVTRGIGSDGRGRPGNGAPGSFGPGAHNATDDHREGHIAELEARFARTITAELAAVVDEVTREHGLPRVIVVASPRMLGTLRKDYGPLARRDLDLVEVAQDLAWLSSAQLHDHLATMNLVEPRARAGAAHARSR